MKSVFLAAVSVLLMSQSVFAQTSTIRGNVVDQSGESILFATVALFSVSDSSLVKGAVTDASGNFEIPQVKAGAYWLNVKFVGYPSYVSEAINVNGSDNVEGLNINIGEKSVDLEVLEISAARPLIEVQPDKTVMNVDGSINATGNSALELLRKSPGVVIDNNNNIALSGKSGVQVLINGKSTYLSAEDLATRLESMKSEEIDAIEIITEPSARYDAEGNGGVINIRLKKDMSLVANANINLGYAYGKNSRYNGGVNANFRKAKYNVFGSYNYSDGWRQNGLNFTRFQNDIKYISESVTERKNPTHNARLGADYFINKNHTIGFLVDGYTYNRKSFTNTDVKIFEQSSGPLSTVLLSESNDKGDRQNFNSNINYQFTGTKNRKLNIDLDYGVFDHENSGRQPNTYTDADGITILSQNQFETDDATNIKIKTARLDYEVDAMDGRVEIGLKTSNVRTDNDYDFYENISNQLILDSNRTNQFVFTENINAVYVSYKRPLTKKLKLSTGMRAEHTVSTGNLNSLVDVENKDVRRDYIDFFPSVGLSYQYNMKNQFRVNYNRRIKRPSYQDLNPFEYKLSEISFRRGNPFVRPQYSSNFSVAHTYNYSMTTTLSYAYTKDYYTNLSDTLGENKGFLWPVNLDNQQVLNLGLSVPFSPKNWWNTYTTINGTAKRNYADFGEGREIDLTVYAASFYHQSTFIVGKGWSFEVSGWGSSPSVWGALFETEANFSIDTGVKKKLFNNRATLKVAFSDIFNTAPWRATQEFAGFQVFANGDYESQQLRVNFSYALGNDKVKKSRNRKTGLEEEQKRIQ